MMTVSQVKKSGGKLENSSSETCQYLSFMLAGEIYAVGILNIKEIIQYGELTEVPMMPTFVRGVINLRGRVVPVIDLAARFGKPMTDVLRRTSIIIIEYAEGGSDEAQSVGIMVDAVNEVVDISHADIEPAPTFGVKIRPDFIRGMGKREGRFIIILNLNNILSVDEMTALSLGGDARIKEGEEVLAEIVH